MSDDGKKKKSEVNYGPGRPNTRCGMCINYRVPKSCVMVSGEIDSEGVCNLYNINGRTTGEE